MPWVVVVIGVVAVGAAVVFGLRLQGRPESAATGRPLLAVGVLFMALFAGLLLTRVTSSGVVYE